MLKLVLQYFFLHCPYRAQVSVAILIAYCPCNAKFNIDVLIAPVMLKFVLTYY